MFVALLYLKKDSASGRILIWKVTCNMVKDNGIFGAGSGAFHANYMEFQADYLSQHPDSKYAQLADDVLQPFNEYLLLLYEYGITGLFLLIVCIISLLRSSKFSSPYFLCLLSLSVFSFFSYPFRYPFIWVVLAYCIAQINREYNKPMLVFKYSNKMWFKISGLIIVITGLFFIIKDIKFEYQWNKVTKKSLLGKTEEVMPQYEQLHNSWNGNKFFLYNYGIKLNHIIEYEKSIEIFKQCEQYWNNYDVQMSLGDNYYYLQRWDEAEQHFVKASHMCPNRFIPLYKLYQINLRKNKKDQAFELANRILKKDVKVPSAIVNTIKAEMKEYIEDFVVSN